LSSVAGDDEISVLNQKVH